MSIQYKNKGRCKLCGDIIESRFRHDFVTCKCGSLSLDGGLAYRRVLWRGGNCNDVLEELFEEVTPQDIQKCGIISAREREMEQEYYRACYAELAKRLEEQKDGKTHVKRTRDAVCGRKVSVRAQAEHGEEVGSEVEAGRTGSPP